MEVTEDTLRFFGPVRPLMTGRR